MSPYQRRNQIPLPVRAFLNCGGYLVGSSARWVIGELDSCRDWDVIIPPANAGQASRLIPAGTRTNSFGGFKVKVDGIEIDVWYETLESFLSTSTGKNAGVAVAPFVNGGGQAIRIDRPFSK